MKYFCPSAIRTARNGFSIVELMIAITISLIVLVVMMQAFRRASGEIKKGRAMIEMATEMRAVGETFRRDLAHVTVSPRVWNLTSECNGYFEIIEGPLNDTTYSANPAMSFFGDIDDLVAMTVRSGEKPFRGRWVDSTGATRILESHIAEIVWFAIHENVDDTIVAPGLAVDMDDRVTLYRRVLLVVPDSDPDDSTMPLRLNGISGMDGIDNDVPPDGMIDEEDELFAAMTNFYLNNDISVRPVGGGLAVNSLGDLTLRENRFAHRANFTAPGPPPVFTQRFPHVLVRNNLPPPLDTIDLLADRRIVTGEDILLSHVAGFDLRVFSPDAPTKSPNATQYLGPNDPNYATNSASADIEGSYVDLGWTGAAVRTSWFANTSPLFPTAATWCSWSPHYFYGSAAANGLDDDLNGLVDEENEKFAPTDPDLTAPYPWPIRSVQLTMRGIEKSTRTVRQVTITSSFVPE